MDCYRNCNHKLSWVRLHCGENACWTWSWSVSLPTSIFLFIARMSLLYHPTTNLRLVSGQRPTTIQVRQLLRNLPALARNRRIKGLMSLFGMVYGLFANEYQPH